MLGVVAGAHGLELRDVPRPVPGPAAVLVRVHAAALNRAELAMAAGAMHGSAGGSGAVIGLEWAGIVEAAGADVPELRPGQRVMCSGSGSYAEYALTDWGRVCPIPDGMDFNDAAALPIALQTMHNAIAGLGRLTPGETVLVHGASSGVGLMGLMVARHLGAGQVVGTSGDAGRRQRLAAYADVVVDSSGEGWASAVLAATDGRGADLTVDLVSGPSINQTMAATAVRGRLIGNGRLGGVASAFDFDLHAARRITYTGSSFRLRTQEEVREINARMRADLWPALCAGQLRLPIDSVFPLAQAAVALDRMRANAHFGKIILAMA